MDPNWAADHLQVIRTLMERAAVYRRALAPVMTVTGAIGSAAALAGWLLKFDSPVQFTSFWLGIGVLAALGAFLLVRQQAVRQQEPFWSPPARRVALAALPAMTIGLVLGVTVLALELVHGSERARAGLQPDLTWLPLAWVVLYGCALHAAGFSTPRGLRLFGWAFVLGGCIAFGVWVVVGSTSARPQQTGHWLMGFFFGLLHLAYGTYLSATERKNAA